MLKSNHKLAAKTDLHQTPTIVSVQLFVLTTSVNEQP
jgi:hypothetical protein